MINHDYKDLNYLENFNNNKIKKPIDSNNNNKNFNKKIEAQNFISIKNKSDLLNSNTYFMMEKR
jgi:hypothetical protein